MNSRKFLAGPAVLALTTLAAPLSGQDTRDPEFAEDGTVSVPAFQLPPSVLSSEEARAAQEMRGRIPVSAMTTGQDPEIGARRATLARMLQPRVDLIQQMYPAQVEEAVIAGVPVRIITPAGGAFDPDRVLINLHGGAFNVCWESCSLIESIPIAVTGGYRVISVNYRMAPEDRHPAGVEDAAAVFSALLEEYDARRIGVFGCSAGGALTAQLAAFLPANGLPQMGAAGIFGAGGVRFQSGDSAYIAANIDGSFPGPDTQGQLARDLSLGYFDGVDYADPVVSPALHPEVIGAFPPTLITTGTRAMDLSPAIVTSSALLREDVASTLIVGEGMGHCYQYNPALPESRDAYAATVRHFRVNLD